MSTQNLQRKRVPPAIIRLSSSVPNEKRANHTTSTKSEDLSTKDKLKTLWKNYGIIAVSTYLGIYATTLGSIFLALDFDLFNAASVGLDPAYAIEKFSQVIETFTGNTSVPSYIRDHPSVGTFAIAWVMTKFTEPVRLGITLISVPTVARWLGHKKKIEEQNEEIRGK